MRPALLLSCLLLLAGGCTHPHTIYISPTYEPGDAEGNACYERCNTQQLVCRKDDSCQLLREGCLERCSRFHPAGKYTPPGKKTEQRSVFRLF